MPADRGRSRWVLNKSDGSGDRVAINELPFVVGRDRGCGLRLESQQVSPRHARFIASSVPQCLFLEDGESDHGTFVNGVRFAEPVPVGDGDTIRFADDDWSLESVEYDVVETLTPEALSALGV